MIKPEHPALFSQRFSIRGDFLRRAEKFTQSNIYDYQSKILRRLYALSFTNSPFYNKKFSSAGLSVDSIQCLDDLSLLPISTKDDLKNAGQDVLTTSKTSQLTTRTTGGSSGNPLIVYGNPSFYSKDKANTYYYVSFFGHDIFSSKSVRLYGNRVVDVKGNQQLYHYSANKLKLELNCFFINDSTLDSIYTEILKHKPAYIHARSRAILSLTRSFEHKAHAGTSFGISHIFVDGENISLSDQSYLEVFYNAKLVNVFGHTEGSLFAFPCQSTCNFHYQFTTGILEVIKDPSIYNLPESFANTALVTGLNNFAMPFIRYATGDIVHDLQLSCDICGHNYFISSPIVGRSSDFVITKDYLQVALSSIMYNYDDVDWSCIKYWQAYQDTPGKLNILVSPLDTFTASEKLSVAKYIQKCLAKLCGPSITPFVELAILEPNPRGKVANFRQYLTGL